MNVKARLTLRAPGALTEAERRQIATWLSEQAAKLMKKENKYVSSGNYTARLF